MPSVPKLSILTSLYRSENYLSQFLAQVSEQSIFAECELILVLNEGSAEEIETIRKFEQQYPEQVQLLRVDKVERLSASWNRAWRAAKAPYLAIWNVDDRRRPDSLMRQVRALEEHSDWVLCYGDFLKVSEYGAEDGKLRHTPIYSSSHFRRAFPQGGAFWVFRAELHSMLGYFDEQFAVGPDFEMSMRIAMRGLKMGREESVLGYFTNEGVGLSTRENFPSMDASAIFIRYAIYDKVRKNAKNQLSKFDIDRIVVNGEHIALTNYLPDLTDYRRVRKPLWALGYLRNILRTIVCKLGLLEFIYTFQRKFIKREI